ncbi:nuclear transport factor 2 family protein [Pseudonocardia acidicola]|uniref:Ester cyclase n=1 Tax=Pseudonocardia acidicola TaxID=2724939 RepID=A0ABX1S608_9PSEU|nr:nuclear transport factor 2 family protein [Pseudonocardia acidicola]NMH97010.1 ester cyclase [Pseudonocardia acidicola]
MTSPDGPPNTDPRSVVTAFFRSLADRDLDGAFALLAPDAEVEVLPAAGQISMDPASAGRAYFAATVSAFPDLLLTVHRTVVVGDGGDGAVLTELSLEGTQAADYLGALNQEKHLDLRQAWLLQVDGGLIRSVRGFWDENQLFRRLAVKRLDRIAIV